MIVVYAGFVAGGFSPVKQLGLGLVLAVAVDATLVRMLLLPARDVGAWATRTGGRRRRCGGCTRASASPRRPRRAGDVPTQPANSAAELAASLKR